MKLDREKPFGTIFGGAPVSGARYEQGGQYFNGAEELIEWPPKKEVPFSTDEEADVVPEPSQPIQPEEPEVTSQPEATVQVEEQEEVTTVFVTPVVKRRKIIKK